MLVYFLHCCSKHLQNLLLFMMGWSDVLPSSYHRIVTLSDRGAPARSTSEISDAEPIIKKKPGKSISTLGFVTLPIFPVHFTLSTLDCFILLISFLPANRTNLPTPALFLDKGFSHMFNINFKLFDALLPPPHLRQYSNKW